MTNTVDKIEKELTDRERLLHKIAKYVVGKAIDANLEVAVMTLDFLKGIEDKTEEDIIKVRNQQKIVEAMTSENYEKVMQNAIVENMDSLSTEHLQRFVDEIEYSEAIAEVQLKMSVAMKEIQDDLILGYVKTEVTH
ncbi:hypothetical protein A73_212 [Escherichia phage A73]|uniref:Uncharacterized protein n=2 Tax=Vequintavirinae TaxID=1911928 RepID=A0AAF0AQL3_9CAUD|nr:hypothetical protein [Escherichia phage UPEC06]UZZ64400.1 hypothetical protein A54_160 [Escherichia phage A5-4]WBF77742.1 hypothetical protein A73_212 [Escherichia phage A73]WBF77994.1 hypothetical protein W70_197 [Escherichia phage W70]